MSSTRPLFFVLLLVAIASSAMGADGPAQSPIASDSIQSGVSASTFSGPEQISDQVSGLIFADAKPRTLNRPPAPGDSLAKLDDGVCYTMRTYKVKRTERLSEGENGRRGYSTCQMATNYQVRSAVAHARAADDSTPAVK